MPNNIETLDKAINLRQLQMAHDDMESKAMQFVETVDPASEDVIDEYERLTANLYQALEDAQQVITPARTATSQAQTATGRAQQAADNANSAASSANNAADAAAEAVAQIEDARGGYTTLAERLDDMELGFIENNNPMSLHSYQ